MVLSIHTYVFRLQLTVQFSTEHIPLACEAAISFRCAGHVIFDIIVPLFVMTRRLKCTYHFWIISKTDEV